MVSVPSLACHIGPTRTEHYERSCATCPRLAWFQRASIGTAEGLEKDSVRFVLTRRFQPGLMPMVLLLSSQGLHRLTLWPDSDCDCFGAHENTAAQSRGGRKEIILPAGAEAKPKAQPNPPLVLALARAYRWQRRLNASSVPGVEAIAAQHNVDRAYVSRMLRLPTQAPDIVRAILAKREPSGLSLARLHLALSLGWDEQRKS